MSHKINFLNHVKFSFFIGDKMKVIYILMGCLLITACGSSNEPVDSSAPQTAVVEYVWQTKGPNYSDEALEKLIDSWNEKVTTAKATRGSPDPSSAARAPVTGK